MEKKHNDYRKALVIVGGGSFIIGLGILGYVAYHMIESNRKHTELQRKRNEFGMPYSRGI